MRRALAMALVIPLLIALAGCGDEDPDIHFGGGDDGPDRYAVLSEDGEVKMGLTDDHLYFALSEQTREEARAEMEAAAEKEGVAGILGGIVEKTVGRALDFRASYPVTEIRDITWEDGRMRIIFEDPARSVGDEFKIDDRPVAEAFPEQAVRAFAEEFRRVKAEQGGDPGS